jgi:hypothetical protein
MKVHVLVESYYNGNRYNREVFSSKKKALAEIDRICKGAERDGYSHCEWKDDYFGWIGHKIEDVNQKNITYYFIESFDVI